ncbi:dynein light chain [Holotrichia oblita]|uniref:Dynein light chain n=1 Tax=Holotrichia oblita TaxID=644536 RepID=A0ACB9T9X3_HOLOL|nr:dynein light chain [Holotrichia oblita]
MPSQSGVEPPCRAIAAVPQTVATTGGFDYTSKLHKYMRTRCGFLYMLVAPIQTFIQYIVQLCGFLPKMLLDLCQRYTDAYTSCKMTDRKAVIKNTDMSVDMLQDALDCTMHAIEKYNIEKNIAAYIKKELDKKYNPTWHCIFGRNFAHNSRNRPLHILLVRTSGDPTFGERLNQLF